MEINVAECKQYSGEWLVEAIQHDSEGEIYVARFSGPNAEQRAKRYAASDLL